MILEDTGIDRKDVYITNIVKCRPPKNRVPSKKEEESCNDFIKQEIEIINPKIICNGKYSIWYAFRWKRYYKESWKNCRKRWKKVFVTFHPAATIYNQKLVDELKEDFKKLAKFLDEEKMRKQYEDRRCDFCMSKTSHEVVVMPKVVTRKRRWLLQMYRV